MAEELSGQAEFLSETLTYFKLVSGTSGTLSGSEGGKERERLRRTGRGWSARLRARRAPAGPDRPRRTVHSCRSPAQAGDRHNAGRRRR